MDIAVSQQNFALKFEGASERGKQWLKSKFGVTEVFIHCSSEGIVNRIAAADLSLKDVTTHMSFMPVGL